MKLQAFHLRVKRVSGLNQDMTPKIENILVKLVGATSLDKYCKHINVRGFVKNDPPKIEKVLARDKDGKFKVLSGDAITDAQAVVDKYINKAGKSEKVDYKAKFENQQETIDALKERLEALEEDKKVKTKAEGEDNEADDTEANNNESSNRDELEKKANELNIQFRSNIGDVKLLEKINEIEPDFK